MDKESNTFHNEDAVFRIAMWANIVSWLALALALLQVVSGVVDLYPQWEQFLMSVPELHKKILILTQYLVAEPVLGGVFAFLMLRGLSQGLYLMMDIYMDDEEEEEYEDEDEVVEED